jgi:hypothetical protein
MGWLLTSWVCLADVQIWGEELLRLCTLTGVAQQLTKRYNIPINLIDWNPVISS